jgi:phosphate/sulfate permease
MVWCEAHWVFTLPTSGLITRFTVSTIHTLIRAVTTYTVAASWITDFTDLAKHTLAKINLFASALPTIDGVKA